MATGSGIHEPAPFQALRPGLALLCLVMSAGCGTPTSARMCSVRGTAGAVMATVPVVVIEQEPSAEDPEVLEEPRVRAE